MKEIIAYINIKDTEIINEIPNFKHIYMYINHEKVAPEEWGKFVFGNIEVKFYACSDLRYLAEKYHPKCEKCLKSH